MNHRVIPSGGEWAIGSLIMLLTLVVPAVLYVNTLQSAFKAVSTENRRMKAGYVWLLLIPLFGIVWHFIVVDKLSDSIRAEAFRKDISISEARPAFGIGLTMCILSCLTWVPIIKVLIVLALIVCWIVFWVKINGYKNRLIAAR